MVINMSLRKHKEINHKLANYQVAENKRTDY